MRDNREKAKRERKKNKLKISWFGKSTGAKGEKRDEFRGKGTREINRQEKEEIINLQVGEKHLTIVGITSPALLQ